MILRGDATSPRSFASRILSKPGAPRRTKVCPRRARSLRRAPLFPILSHGPCRGGPRKLSFCERAVLRSAIRARPRRRSTRPCARALIFSNAPARRCRAGMHRNCAPTLHARGPARMLAAHGIARIDHSPLPFMRRLVKLSHILAHHPPAIEIGSDQKIAEAPAANRTTSVACGA